MCFDLYKNSTLFEVCQKLKYRLCMGLTMMWHIDYALCEYKIVIHSDVASGGVHHFTREFHIMWHGK
jgi:hypothetical protein